MKDATLDGGINCILMSTDVTETDASSGERRPGLIELHLSADQAFSILREVYSGWEIMKEQRIQQTIPELQNEKEILFESTWITFIARKGCR